jgi:hypothetical protein
MGLNATGQEGRGEREPVRCKLPGWYGRKSFPGLGAVCRQAVGCLDIGHEHGHGRRELQQCSDAAIAIMDAVLRNHGLECDWSGRERRERASPLQTTGLVCGSLSPLPS